MRKFMSDGEADRFLLYAIGAWAMCVVSPLVGMLWQFLLVGLLVWKCDVKTLPALMLLVLQRSNIAALPQVVDVLRLGITWKSASFLMINVFLFAIHGLIRDRYDRPTQFFGFFWLLSIIPAVIMSFQAKANGVVGMWSNPIMDFLVPGMYFWAILMAPTLDAGRYYFVSRMAYILAALVPLLTFHIIGMFNTFVMSLSICICFYAFREPRLRNLRPVGVLCLIAGVAHLLFGRMIAMKSAIEMYGLDVNDVDLSMGSTFARMTTVATAVFLSFTLKNLSGQLIRMVPIVLLVTNISIVGYVISTQSGNDARDVNQEYGTVAERFQYKLFGDRAAVWKDGWNDVKTPPYIFKDLRQFQGINDSGQLATKLMPHNQFLTLLAWEGFWLGLTLSIFIVWIQVRAFRCYTKMQGDNLFAKVFLPVSAAVFFAFGTAGQAVMSGDLWGSALVAIIMPGLVYGEWLDRRRRSFMMTFD